jgi:hypothetical protein
MPEFFEITRRANTAAGAFGFLPLIQCRGRPERYGNWNSVFVRFTRSYTLLCIYKSSRQASNLPCGMWQMGHTVRQCGSG